MMKILYDAATLRARVTDLAATLSKELTGHKVIHTVITMNGSLMFASDLCRALTIPQILHFTGGSYFQGAIKQEIGLNPETLPTNFNHNPVLIIEDILDSGNSIRQLRQLLAERNAGPVTVVALFKRIGSPTPKSADEDMPEAPVADHVAFSLPREMFVVGYGLDMDGRFRELKDIFLFEGNIGATGNC